MQALILCGGHGTRAWPATAEVPKPMLDVGGRPALWHVMAIHARQGVTDFVLATGYKGEVIDRYVAGLDESWRVRTVDTGVDADTGDRVRACLDRLDETFLVTYGDGLGNVDLGALTDRHHEHTGSVTVTVVPLPSQYGTLVTDDAGRVTEFREKPVLAEHLINAGFFVVDRSAVADTPGGSLERDLLPELGRRGELFVYRHDGFWRSMDTYKDVVELTRLAHEEGNPWLTAPVSRDAPHSTNAASSSPERPASSART